MNRLAALLSILALITAQGARAVNCSCAPCPLEAGGTCEPEPTPPCCGEPEPEESCSCAHFAAPEGVPPDVDVATGVAVIDVAIPVVTDLEDAGDVVAVTPRGPGPPTSPLPIYLRDLSLRL